MEPRVKMKSWMFMLFKIIRLHYSCPRHLKRNIRKAKLYNTFKITVNSNKEILN